MTRMARMLIMVGAGAAVAGCNREAGFAGPDAAAPALEVSAAAPAAAASTTTMSVNGCDFTVTYTWSGFKGRNLTASYGLYSRSAGLDQSITLDNVTGQLGKSGSVTHTFSLTSNASASRTIVARGALYNSRKNTQIAGSSSASSNTVNSTCG